MYTHPTTFFKSSNEWISIYCNLDLYQIVEENQFKVNETVKNFDSEYYDMLLNYNPDSICKFL